MTSLAIAWACAAALGCTQEGEDSQVSSGKEPVGASTCGRATAVRALVGMKGGQSELQDAVLVDKPGVKSAKGPLKVVDAAGRELASAAVPEAGPVSVILPEEEGGDGEVGDGGEAVSVLVPWPEGAVAIVLGSVRIEAPACSAELGKADGIEPAPIWSSGPHESRFNLTIFADGFTEDERQSFLDAAQSFADGYLATEPYATLKGIIDIDAVFLPSRESGAGSDGAPKDTALGCFYGCSGVERLVCCDASAVYEATVANAPESDAALVIVNDTRYGGAGSTSYASTTLSYAMVDTALHELGHQMGLADEYTYVGFTGGSGSASPNCSASAEETHWDAWRTPETDVGAFPGCSYEDLYRPTDDGCLMKRLRQPYCPVCREHVVRTLFVRSGGIADSTEPQIKSVNFAPVGSPLTLRATAKGPAEWITYSWRKDGAALAETGPELRLDACDDGRYDLEMKVASPWIRGSDPAGTGETVTWNIRCGEPGDAPTEPVESSGDSRSGKEDEGAACEHSAGGLYGHRACSASYQCCDGTFRRGQGACGECTCVEATGRTGCGAKNCTHSLGGIYAEGACSASYQCCGGAWNSVQGLCGECTCVEASGRIGCRAPR